MDTVITGEAPPQEKLAMANTYQREFGWCRIFARDCSLANTSFRSHRRHEVR
jgi:hypothetical protein